ncbi:hypothetical protein [Bifidobacterium myosotis]|uniref:Uncharacterized protein n=1 Tax=Bifidobacterium myosotis TaxID=1630166 RepID=A0A5M9ZH66_9BIFI|nr:hypothetical protein [Bifidobacterium myosotis]KAA8826957.1 hypothetical protein EMO91_10525 [Bifidobacterium myosotis]
MLNPILRKTAAALAALAALAVPSGAAWAVDAAPTAGDGTAVADVNRPDITVPTTMIGSGRTAHDLGLVGPFTARWQPDDAKDAKLELKAGDYTGTASEAGAVSFTDKDGKAVDHMEASDNTMVTVTGHGVLTFTDWTAPDAKAIEIAGGATQAVSGQFRELGITETGDYTVAVVPNAKDGSIDATLGDATLTYKGGLSGKSFTLTRKGAQSANNVVRISPDGVYNVAGGSITLTPTDEQPIWNSDGGGTDSVKPGQPINYDLSEWKGFIGNNLGIHLIKGYGVLPTGTYKAQFIPAADDDSETLDLGLTRKVTIADQGAPDHLGAPDTTGLTRESLPLAARDHDVTGTPDERTLTLGYMDLLDFGDLRKGTVELTPITLDGANPDQKPDQDKRTRYDFDLGQIRNIDGTTATATLGIIPTDDANAQLPVAKVSADGKSRTKADAFTGVKPGTYTITYTPKTDETLTGEYYAKTATTDGLFNAAPDAKGLNFEIAGKADATDAKTPDANTDAGVAPAAEIPTDADKTDTTDGDRTPTDGDKTDTADKAKTPTEQTVTVAKDGVLYLKAGEGMGVAHLVESDKPDTAKPDDTGEKLADTGVTAVAALAAVAAASTLTAAGLQLRRRHADR